MDKVLDKVNSPADLKSLAVMDLQKLAGELRELIIKVVSENGGHLASSLGAIELTIALHRVFNSFDDKIVWDVGHQCYAHKILTGRKEQFLNLRKAHGVSGFPKINESRHDAFGTGHASTSISAALGIAKANELNGNENKTIAIIGDGSLAGGIALEGLNNSGHSKCKNLIVVLNDNEMSISKSVGALSSFLSRKTTSVFALRVRNEIKKVVKSVPSWGNDLLGTIKRVKALAKGLYSPGVVFECLGFRYIGPIDGHDINLLCETFNNIKGIEGPLLVHVITKKGQGYPYAMENPSSFHGVEPFCVETGKKRKIVPAKTYSDVFGTTLTQLASKDDKIVAITAAMKDGTGLSSFATKFPTRFFDVGIAEQHAVTFAAGLATQGLKPVVAVYSTFLQRAYDQIVHDVCLQKLNVVFALDRAGLVGEDGPTHHGLFDISYLRHIPNMTVMAPKDEVELKDMLKTALIISGPVAIRYPRGMGIGRNVEVEPDVLEKGKGEIIQYSASKGYVLIIGVGPIVYEAFSATKMLKKEGIETCLLNARFIKPLDIDLIAGLSKNASCIITLEEGIIEGGFGSFILEKLSYVKKPVLRIGIADEFAAAGTQAELRRKYKLDCVGICEQVKNFYFENFKKVTERPSTQKNENLILI